MLKNSIKFLFFVGAIFNCINFSYSQKVELIAPLTDPIQESSGLIFLNDRLITHTDSNGGPFLYEYDIQSNSISRKVEVKGATNVDWEDITFDDQFIYICDSGNNSGNRIDLKIYRIQISDYLDGDDIVESDIIEFKYKEQEIFKKSTYYTKFDAEALVAHGDYLYLFTKDWIDYKTSLYRIPKEKGNYSIESLKEYSINGLVSGATVFNDEIFVSGYGEEGAFFAKLKDWQKNSSKDNFSKFDIDLPEGISFQVEGIAINKKSELILTSESGIFGQGYILKIQLD